MNTLQDRMQERNGLLFVLLVSMAASLWVFEHRSIPWEFLVGQDEMEYADLSRRIARGEGFTTGLIYPVELEYGAERDHPNLIRAPVWPALLGGVFAVFGASEPVAHGLLLVLFSATVGVCGLLGAKLAGPVFGLLAAVAVAITPTTQALSFLALTEPLFGLLFVCAFLLMARGAPAWAVGAVCGLVYLTRFNGIALLPVALVWCLFRRDRGLALLTCAAGFAVLAIPWWVRNAVVTGDPFFTFYYNTTRMSAGVRGHYTESLMHYLDPSTAGAAIVSPFDKARELLPLMIRQSPFWTANWAACIGVAIGCVRRDRTFWVFALLLVATTLGLSLVLPRGRYFAPLFPALVVFGLAGFAKLERWPIAVAAGVALVLVMPLLPRINTLPSDLAFIEGVVKIERDLAPRQPWQDCIRSEHLVFGERASDIAWKTDATTIWLTATEPDFWIVADSYPIDYVYLEQRRDLLTERFGERFERAEECGPHVFRPRVVSPG